jgi:hypothetical protein
MEEKEKQKESFSGIVQLEGATEYVPHKNNYYDYSKDNKGPQNSGITYLRSRSLLLEE